MASAWGAAFGKAWGNSWGLLQVRAPVSGGSSHHRVYPPAPDLVLPKARLKQVNEALLVGILLPR